MTTYLARMRGHYPSGRPWGSGLHLNSPDSPSVLLSAWVSAVTDFWTNGSHGVNTFYNTGVILDSVDVVTLDPATGHQIAKTPPTVLSLAGTSADTQMPDRDAIHVSLTGASIGPGTRGGMFLPAPVEGTQNAGEFSNPLITRVGVAARALLSAIAADGTVAYVWNREPTIHKPTPFTQTVVTTAECSSKVASKESRVKNLRASFG